MMIRFSASIILPSQQNSICLGTVLTLTAAPDPTNSTFPSGKPTWSGIDSPYLSATSGASITINAQAPAGTYLVKASHNNTKVIKVVIADVFVASISDGDKTSTKETADSITENETIYILQGTPLTLAAVPNPSTSEFPEGKPTWSGINSSYFSVNNDDKSITINSQAPVGTYTISASCNNTKVIKVVIGGLEKLEYQKLTEEWAEEDTLYVLKGTTVPFRAVLSNENAFPSTSPTWSGVASGTGISTSVTFNTVSTGSTDYKTVTVTYGGVSKSINVVVYEATLEIMFEKTFTGRSETKCGIYEKFECGVQIVPAVVASTAITVEGDGNWTSAFLINYTAPATAGSVTFSTTIDSGYNKGHALSKTITIVEPEKGILVVMRRHHKENTVSVGATADAFILPQDVSFAALEFREGTGEVTATGIFLNDNGKIHSVGGWKAINPGGSTLMSDVFYIYHPNATGDKTGTYIWNFNWEYRKKDTNDTPKEIPIAPHTASSNSIGTATISKADSGSITRAYDASDENPFIFQ